jgi:multidrug efflux pump
VKNGVVWIDCVEQRRQMGDSLRESVIRAGIYRLRPILLASVTTIGGLLPLALFGGVLFEPMAYAMIGGLALVTVYTLVVIPVFYMLIVPNETVLDRS